MQRVLYVINGRLHDGLADPLAAVVGITNHNVNAWWPHTVILLQLNPNDANRLMVDDNHPGYLFALLLKLDKLMQDGCFALDRGRFNLMLSKVARPSGS